MFSEGEFFCSHLQGRQLINLKKKAAAVSMAALIFAFKVGQSKLTHLKRVQFSSWESLNTYINCEYLSVKTLP